MIDIENEFADADLGDRRRAKRLAQIAGAIAKRPDAMTPDAFGSQAELEAYYRFVENPYFEAQAVLAPHIAQTVKRAAAHETILVLHDTTKCTFPGRHENLGRVDSPKREGFLAHVALAVTADETRTPLGVLACNPWVRSEVTPTSLRKAGLSQAEARGLPSEKDRWSAQANEVEETIGASASVVHVMDSEADDFELLAQMRDQRFVVRMYTDRKLGKAQQALGLPKTRELMKLRPVLATREVSLSARNVARQGENRNPPRVARTASLEIRAAQLDLLRPDLCDRKYPKELPLNVVHVREAGGERGQKPIEWMLVTSEPVEDTENVLAVVDFYRARWVIEEFFRALKTGCAYETRQMDTYEALTKVLAISLPIAWRLLLMRSISRIDGKVAADVMGPSEIAILRLRTNMPIGTAAEAWLALARLGGHLKHNGPPGWLILWRGFQKLQALVEGFELASGLMAAAEEQLSV